MAGALFDHFGFHAFFETAELLAVAGFNALLNQGVQQLFIFIGIGVWASCAVADGLVGQQAGVLEKALGFQQDIEGGVIGMGFIKMLYDVVAGGRAQVQEIQNSGVWWQGDSG